VDKNFQVRDGGRSQWPILPADKLVDLLTSFSHLRSSNRALVQTLRGSIHELRELRTRLQNKPGKAVPSRNDNGPETGLAQQFGLTRREVQVAILLAQGRSNQAIARELGISAHTARHHTQRVLSKLDVHSRGEAGAKIRAS
jgi:DNA-binding NarL/FixJ family response regulator